MSSKFGSEQESNTCCKGEFEMICFGDVCKIWYDGNSAFLRDVYYRHKRPKLGVDPEAVLLKSGLESSTAAAFLHENMLEFVDHDAVEDAAGACSYLSDAGLH